MTFRSGVLCMYLVAASFSLACDGDTREPGPTNVAADGGGGAVDGDGGTRAPREVFTASWSTPDGEMRAVSGYYRGKRNEDGTKMIPSPNMSCWITPETYSPTTFRVGLFFMDVSARVFRGSFDAPQGPTRGEVTLSSGDQRWLTGFGGRPETALNCSGNNAVEWDEGRALLTGAFSCSSSFIDPGSAEYTVSNCMVVDVPPEEWIE